LERGTDVAVLGQAGDWYEVQVPDGRNGWRYAESGLEHSLISGSLNGVEIEQPNPF
jgi:hypothetical protein